MAIDIRKKASAAKPPSQVMRGGGTASRGGTFYAGIKARVDAPDYLALTNRLVRRASAQLFAEVPLQVNEATLPERTLAEQRGVHSSWIRRFVKSIDVDELEVWRWLEVSQSTADRKIKKEQVITGLPGQAAINALSLLGKARNDLKSAVPDDFDVDKWFGQWLRTPQPALGGRPPADVIATPSGSEMVSKLLDSLVGGAYL